MSKELAPLEALEILKEANAIYCGCASNLFARYRFEIETIETALKDYEMQKRIVKDLTACKYDLIEERNKRIIERRAIYDDYNFQFLKRDVACKGCQYYENEKCTNKDDCFWLELERKLKAFEIIKEKKVDIVEFFRSPTCFAYNAHHIVFSQDLTQEEFDLLKEVLCRDNM